MRPQGFAQGAPGLEDLGWNDMGFEPPKPADTPQRDDEHDAFGEELDEHRVHPTGLTPVQSPVHTQHAEIADRLGVEEDEEVDETAEPFEGEAAPVAILPAPAPMPRRSVTPRAAPGSKGKAAFTLRLDPERHLKLRLACAVNGRSAQNLVTDALDQLLENMPELEAMAGKAKRKG
jgi:sugar phosphate isomerase/epimerase